MKNTIVVRKSTTTTNFNGPQTIDTAKRHNVFNACQINETNANKMFFFGLSNEFTRVP